jgi:phosphate uptake regulator
LDIGSRSEQLTRRKLEVQVEEDCLKILALYQPAAIDLRYVVGILKMNNDLERMGDLSVNIAERTTYLAQQREIDLFLDFSDMSEKTIGMVKGALDPLIKMDATMAKWSVLRTMKLMRSIGRCSTSYKIISPKTLRN